MLRFSLPLMGHGKWFSTLLGAVPFIMVFVLWSAVTYGGLVQPFFLPTPTALARGLWFLFAERSFASDIAISIERVLTGFVIAVVLAIPLGIAVGLSRKMEAIIEPIVGFIRYTPTPALIPLFILWFGIGETEKVIVIAQSVFFQLVLMVANAVASTPKELIESARTLGAGRGQIVYRVILPFVKPRIYDDLRISVGWAWSALMAAEIVGASSGIGLVVIEAQRLLRTPNVMGGILVIGIIGLITDITMRNLYPVFFPWAPKLKAHA
ncbi:ABC transporter permease [Candidatus Uhrbacteria bacterium]|nr:ABC transporter permease [Candidatus Uhrbacteria bacterium]